MTQYEYYVQKIQCLLERADQGETLTEDEKQLVVQYCLLGERLANNSQN